MEKGEAYGWGMTQVSEREITDSIISDLNAYNIEKAMYAVAIVLGTFACAFTIRIFRRNCKANMVRSLFTQGSETLSMRQ